jgi:ribosomal protein L11 methyltransferase
MPTPQPYIQYFISTLPDSEEAAILIAQLSEIGFEGFEEQEATLVGGGKKGDLDEEAADSILNIAGIHFTKKEVLNQNWNAIWESSFEPVLVNDFAGVRADFHGPILHVQHDIVITPKMSFGTGHHATTWLMIAAMEELDFKDKKVLDFGTGTGVLAILAEKLGAKEVIAVDNDEWSIENAAENLTVNEAHHCTLLLKNSISLGESVDILLANINRHVILEHIGAMKGVLKDGGIWLLSGLLEADETIIREKAEEVSMVWKKTSRRNGWISLVFVSKSI